MVVTIYHNPRCSKSRQTLKLLQDKGIEPRIVEYLRTPPDKETLRHLITMLGISPRELLRRKEAPYKELGLADPQKSDEEIIAAMVEHPVLIERPIVVKDERAALGRPPEQVLEILWRARSSGRVSVTGLQARGTRHRLKSQPREPEPGDDH